LIPRLRPIVLATRLIIGGRVLGGLLTGQPKRPAPLRGLQ
jgi:hypothetical protein